MRPKYRDRMRAPTKRVVLARRARRIIEADFAESGCDTRTIARRLGVTRSHLCHAYRETFDSTIGRDVRRRRIAVARRLLEERPGALIKEIAARVGYGHNSYRTFLNAFRQETGIAPRRYQRLTATDRMHDGKQPSARRAGGDGRMRS